MNKDLQDPHDTGEMVADDESQENKQINVAVEALRQVGHARVSGCAAALPHARVNCDCRPI